MSVNKIFPPIRKRERGISTRRGIMCSHLETVYKKEPFTWSGKSIGKPINLDESIFARDHCIILPLFHEIEEKEIEKVCRTIKEIIKNR